MRIVKLGIGLLAMLLVLGCEMLTYGTIGATGLEGYWQFNDNRYDSSANNRYLILEGGPTYGTGRLGKAVAFDGDSSKAAYEAKANTVFDIGADDFTVQVWVSFNSLTLEQVLIEKWSQEPAIQGYTLTKLPGSVLRFAYSNDGTEIDLDTADLSFATGTWYHIVIRRSGTDFDIFVDGVSVRSATMDVDVVSSSNPLRIAARVGGQHVVDGLVDEVAFWSRALSDLEITDYYNAGAGLAIVSD